MDENRNGLLSIEDMDISEAPIKDVDITNDVMFSYVMRNPDICIEMLQYLLPGKKISKIDYLSVDESDSKTERKSRKPETQKVMVSEFDKRGVRLDVYLDDGKTVYNVEMQATDDKALARRTRLYQAHIDINQLERGHHYDQLKPSFIIFICKYDPFKKGLYRYGFENVCSEEPELKLADEAYKLFFNTSGTRGDISDNLKELLRYMNDTRNYPIEKTTNDLIKKIERAVIIAKKDEDWRRAYMTQRIRDRQIELRGIELGEKRGIELGEKRGIELGEKRGGKAKQIEIARNMLSADMSADTIASITGLSLFEVKELEDGKAH